MVLHGIHSHGFPNLMMGGPQSGFPFNFMSLIEQQGTHVATCVARCTDEGIDKLEPTEQTALVQTANPETIAFYAACTPGYYNGEGAVTRSGTNDALQEGSFFLPNQSYGEGPESYYRLLAEVRADGELGGLFDL